jgi:hypothetical protein
MNKHPRVRTLHVAANVTTDTTTDPVECESPEPKTAFARIQGTGAIAQTIELYGNVTESNDDGVLLATFVLSGTTKDTDAIGALIAPYKYYYVTTADTSGTACRGTVWLVY